MPELKIVPFYTTSGDLTAFMVYPYLFNRSGEWIGFVSKEREVFSVQGRYVGFIAAGPRILRKRSYGFDRPLVVVPPAPRRLRVPASAPLPPMMPELSFAELDVLEDEPHLLPTIDSGEFREDMD